MIKIRQKQKQIKIEQKNMDINCKKMNGNEIEAWKRKQNEYSNRLWYT